MQALVARDIALVRAPNPGPFTLTGTNSYVVGRDPAWVIDPGPDSEAHLDALAAELAARGGLGGIALTHDHGDHAEGIEPLRRREGAAPLAGARGDVDIRLADGDSFGPLRALATPDTRPTTSPSCSATPRSPAMPCSARAASSCSPTRARWPATWRRSSASTTFDWRCCAPATARQCSIRTPSSASTSSIASIASAPCWPRWLAADARFDELLDDAWSDVPAQLRPAAAVTLAAHLDKLAAEGRLPDGVQRPQIGALR